MGTGRRDAPTADDAQETAVGPKGTILSKPLTETTKATADRIALLLMRIDYTTLADIRRANLTRHFTISDLYRLLGKRQT